MPFNSARPSNFEHQVKRFVHQPLTIDHGGYHVQIHENGRVTITAPPDSNSGEFDEINAPASLIFKVSDALRMTRREEFVKLASVSGPNKAGQTTPPSNSDSGK